MHRRKTLELETESDFVESELPDYLTDELTWYNFRSGLYEIYVSQATPSPNKEPIFLFTDCFQPLVPLFLSCLVGVHLLYWNHIQKKDASSSQAIFQFGPALCHSSPPIYPWIIIF